MPSANEVRFYAFSAKEAAGRALLGRANTLAALAGFVTSACLGCLSLAEAAAER